MRDATLTERLAADGFEPLGNTPEEFAAMIAAAIALWAEAIKMTGVEEK